MSRNLSGELLSIRRRSRCLLASGLLWAGYAAASNAQSAYGDVRPVIKGSLSAADLGQIRTALSSAEASRPIRRIVSIDTVSLNFRRHILVVEAQITGCLTVHVLKRENVGFAQVWSLEKVPSPDAVHMPDRDFTQNVTTGICPRASHLPNVHGTSDGQIVLSIPYMLDAFERSIPSETYKFVWDGQTYRMINQEQVQ